MNAKTPATCPYCSKAFKSYEGVRTHARKSPACLAAADAAWKAANAPAPEAPAAEPSAFLANLAALPSGHPLRRMHAKANPGYEA